MSRKSTARIVPLLALAVIATGCTKKLSDRITLLERGNTDLLGKLEATQAELDAVNLDRSDLEQHVEAARREAESLQDQLAERPGTREDSAPGWTAVPGGAMISIADSVLFAPGKAVVRKQALPTLDRIANALNQEYADKQILVFGHTDDRPIRKSGWDDNWQLSTERALAVVRHLGARGVSADRLVAGGCGPHQPRTANDTELNRAANRRVEIFAVDAQSRTAGR